MHHPLNSAISYCRQFSDKINAPVIREAQWTEKYRRTTACPLPCPIPASARCFSGRHQPGRHPRISFPRSGSVYANRICDAVRLYTLAEQSRATVQACNTGARAGDRVYGEAGRNRRLYLAGAQRIRVGRHRGVGLPVPGAQLAGVLRPLGCLLLGRRARKSPETTGCYQHAPPERCAGILRMRNGGLAEQLSIRGCHAPSRALSLAHIAEFASAGIQRVRISDSASA